MFALLSALALSATMVATSHHQDQDAPNALQIRNADVSIIAVKV